MKVHAQGTVTAATPYTDGSSRTQVSGIINDADGEAIGTIALTVDSAEAPAVGDSLDLAIVDMPALVAPDAESDGATAE